jgi:hypothetical protein
MPTTRQGYAKSLLEHLAALDQPHHYPLTLTTVEGLVCWMVAEGGNAAWNPMNTTWVVPGHSTPLPGNSAGVQEYDSQAVGLEATTRTLLAAWHDGVPTGTTYADVLTSLRAGWGPVALLQRVHRSPWGTKIGDGSEPVVSAFVAGVEGRWASDGGAYTYISES